VDECGRQDRIVHLREFAVKKEVRCAEFLSTKIELLDRRGKMRHDLLMQKAGWSLLSTAKKELVRTFSVGVCWLGLGLRLGL